MRALAAVVASVALLCVPTSARVHPTHPRIAVNAAFLSAAELADRIDNRLLRGGYITNEIQDPDNPDQNYTIDAEITAPRRQFRYGYRTRVYFYDGPNSSYRFVALAKATIRVDRHGNVLGSYGWLKFPRRA